MVVGRASAFADPRIIELAKTKFVPVTADDWYQRRRQDDEGVFFRKVADQGPRKGAGGSTRQGIYTFTADGTLLEFKNAGQDTEATYDQLQRALKKWASLPEAKRRPGAVEVPPHGRPDEKYSRMPPKDGAILKVNGRILDWKDSYYCRGTCSSIAAMKASRDFLWLTADDVRSLVPEKPETGSKFELPAGIARRIIRFHLVDNTRGEPRFWKKSEVKKNAISLAVMSRQTTPAKDIVGLRLEGIVEMKTDKNDRGYDARLAGEIRYDLLKKVIVTFDMVAVGEHWGDDSVTNGGNRPGKSLYGVAFQLADPTQASQRVSPQAARDWGMYLGKD